MAKTYSHLQKLMTQFSYFKMDVLGKETREYREGEMKGNLFSHVHFRVILLLYMLTFCFYFPAVVTKSDMTKLPQSNHITFNNDAAPCVSIYQDCARVSSPS